MHEHHEAYLTGAYSVISNRMVRLCDHYLTQTTFRYLLACLGPECAASAA